MRRLVPGVVLAVALGISGCGGGGSGGNDRTDAASAAIKKGLLAESSLSVGMTLSGMILAVTDSASSYFGRPGPRAENVKVGDVTLKDKEKTAEADVTFDLVDRGVTCTGAALAFRTGDAWDLSALTVSSCS
jgi:hypothetical protein